MDTMTFRRATAEDLPAIIRLLADDPLGQGREVLSDPPDWRYVDAFEAIDRITFKDPAVAISGPPIEALGSQPSRTSAKGS